MIASLRGRLVAGVVVLAGVGMLLVGTITYAAQRDFLLDRVDAQLASAVRHEQEDTGPHRPPMGGGGPPRGGGAPTDTYVEHRTASGEREGNFLGPGDSATKPDLPDELPLDEAQTIGDYRVLAVDDPGGGMTVAAISMDATDEALERLLVVEGIVIVGVLALVGGFALVVVRVGLLPLDRMGHTAAAIAGGDLSHRVETTDPRTEVGRLGIALNRMLDRLEDAFAARALPPVLLVRLGLRPLDRLGETADALAAGDLSRRVTPATSKTEVGRLGLALNAMLARLEHAFTRQQASEDRLRRFLADASHELRTPLVAIRGYAELYRMGAARSEEDVAKSMRRIEDEAARMGVLVEDLLTLARLDEVRAAPHGPVDLAALARDAVDDARVTAPDREISLDAEPARVTGDADQLRQVLANLLRNALVHTPAGTPIEVTVDSSVRLEVRDHGRGLPTDDSGSLFERFWRAEAGRERGKGGAGLGLAIVAGIVDAHGGTVSAANAPDGGAAFEVRLPAR
jgi:two-component system OmpR family sensor kinase